MQQHAIRTGIGLQCSTRTFTSRTIQQKEGRHVCHVQAFANSSQALPNHCCVLCVQLEMAMGGIPSNVDRHSQVAVLGRRIEVRRVCKQFLPLLQAATQGIGATQTSLQHVFVMRAVLCCAA